MASRESGSAAAGSCSRTTSSANTGPSGLVAHLPAHVGEEFPFGGGEALDAARRDLVEHAVDLRLCGIARRAARLGARVAGPGGPARVHPHARLRRTPQLPLGPRAPPIGEPATADPRSDAGETGE